MRIGLALWTTPLVLQAQCVNFPPNMIALSTVNYVTAADSLGITWWWARSRGG